MEARSIFLIDQMAIISLFHFLKIKSKFVYKNTTVLPRSVQLKKDELLYTRGVTRTRETKM